MEFDLRHSLVNSLANIMYYYINCTYILFKFTLFKTHFLCLISRLYLLHKIRYATLVFFIAKKQMTVIGNDIIGNSPVYTCTLIDCATTHWNFLFLIFLLFLIRVMRKRFS